MEWAHKFMHYRNKHGPFNVAFRTELAIARAVSPFLKNVKPRDFMIWPIEEPQEASVEDVFAMFRGLVPRKKDGQ